MSANNSLIFKKMTNQSSDLIFAMNEELYFKEVNEAVVKNLNSRQSELIELSFLDIVEKPERI